MCVRECKKNSRIHFERIVVSLFVYAWYCIFFFFFFKKRTLPVCIKPLSVVHSISSPGKMYVLKSALELRGKCEWKTIGNGNDSDSMNTEKADVYRSIFNAYVHQKICIRASSNIFFFSFISLLLLLFLLNVTAAAVAIADYYFVFFFSSISLRFFALHTVVSVFRCSVAILIQIVCGRYIA